MILHFLGVQVLVPNNPKQGFPWFGPQPAGEGDHGSPNFLLHVHVMETYLRV